MLHIRLAELFPAGLNGPDHEGHVHSHIPDGFTAFRILQDILAFEAVYVVPVGAGHVGMPLMPKNWFMIAKVALGYDRSRLPSTTCGAMGEPSSEAG